MKNEIWDINESRDYYFTFHHSAGDTMDVMDPDQMDENVISIASLFYILADLDDHFPRD